MSCVVRDSLPARSFDANPSRSLVSSPTALKQTESYLSISLPLIFVFPSISGYSSLAGPYLLFAYILKLFCGVFLVEAPFMRMPTFWWITSSPFLNTVKVASRSHSLPFEKKFDILSVSHTLFFGSNCALFLQSRYCFPVT